MRVLIVDDEPLARRGVMSRLNRYPDIEVVGGCEDGASAVQAILERAPDLVFLDIQMPGMTGFDVLRLLPKHKMPHVIFLTAHEDYALQAFEVHALDYLLKPFTQARFADALDRARAQGKQPAGATTRMLQLLEKQTPQAAARFVIRSGSRIQLVEGRDIDWISAAGDYVEMHARGVVHLLRETMTALEIRLDPSSFARIHCSKIINLSRILELRNLDNGEYMVKLQDGTQHRSSRTFAHKINEWLGR